ncbi:efflux RND transporter periplasmic adaptor subunit [Laspinema olomoucense]|uniref:efflux RND transporter periplasmic adaptor subunit n=1 Tax=Laspinema olomoucense TaxID=3231600 RepID=UPI0021BA655E|nr:efflux RND transporter periplasmic adaptor subunit [Laspinema sp. D3a]MCT7989412.1 efflux RND transporter periplasmic adaptor subunit [Laspinema sp. D3a]
MRSLNYSNLTPTLLAAILLVMTPAAVLAHLGHGNEFEGGADASNAPTGGIEVDSQTLERMGILVEPVQQAVLEAGIKATGQIETLPNETVEVTAPIAGKIIQLLVEPGEAVQAGDAVAILSSPELAALRVDALQKQAEAESNLKQADANWQLAQQNYQRQVTIADAEIAQGEQQVATAQSRYERDRNLVDERGVLTAAEEGYRRQVELAEAEIAAAQKQVEIAQSRYERDRQLVEEGGVLSIARENYQRQMELAEAEIAQAETELGVAQERFERDRELVAQGAIPRRQMLDSEAHFAAAKSAVKRAQSRLGQLQAQSEVKRAEIDLPLRDLRESEELLARSQTELARAQSRLGQLQAESDVKQAEADLPLRDLRESEDLLAQAQGQLTRARSRQGVIAAEAELKRADAELKAAKSQLNLSDRTYQTRLKQLNITPNEQGTVMVTSPITGVVAHRDITWGQSVDAAGTTLMKIQNQTRVGAIANLYEKDLPQVKIGQRVNIKVGSFPNRIFTGRIDYIAPDVQGETRVIPVRAEVDNVGQELKPGMFAELEIATDKSSEGVTSIPESALVEVNNLPVVYVQNGQQFQPVEVKLGQKFGERIEVKGGLFAGDRIVTEGAMQLYAQSLRGRSNSSHDHPQETEANPINATGLMQWGWLPLGGAIAGVAFLLGRRSKPLNKSTGPYPTFSSEIGEFSETTTGEFCELPVLVNPHHHQE